MAQSLIPALTSIDEEEEILSDLKSITDLDLLKRLRTSGKMVHTKAGKKLMESIAAKADRDTVRALRAVYVRDFDLLEKRHDRYVQCKAPNYSQDDLDGEKDWIQAVIYDHLAILAKCDDYLALTNSRSASFVSRASSRHSSVSSRQAKIHEAERKEKEAELMLQQVEDETRRRKEEDYKRKVESERRQREIRDEIDLQRMSGAIMRQQLNDLTVDDQAVPTRASSFVSGLSRVSRTSSRPSLPNNATLLAQTPAASIQASTMTTTAPVTRIIATPQPQPSTVVISMAAQTQPMTTPLVGSTSRIPTPTRLFGQPAATMPSTPKVNIFGKLLKAFTPSSLTRSASVPYIPLNAGASNASVTTSITNQTPTVPKKGGASRGVSADDVQAGSTLNPQQIPPNLHRDVDDSRAGCEVYKTANLTELVPFSDHRVLQGVGGRIKKPPLPIGSRQSTIFPRYEQVPEPFLDSIRDREGALSTAKRRAGDVAVLKPAKSVSPNLDLATPRGGQPVGSLQIHWLDLIDVPFVSFPFRNPRADKNSTVVESRTRAPGDNNPHNRIHENENENKEAATAAATGAEEMTVASTKATANSNARVTATKNPPPVIENAAQKSKGDPTAAATRAKEMTLASTNAKEKSIARATATKNPPPVIEKAAQKSKGDSTATATGTQAGVTASKTAVTNAGAKVTAPRRILTREVIFPRKYKDFVVQTRRN
ncbi:hypothetical protein DAPPUDRAFT_102662 [Daphnia pulex]|uniref:Uncharacterized protein n=1 Tax=Daphnia pulex TaxID=6669 RepID=E9GH35_DAPPU|nr:hypothetical protein DAPPUDRAFT_102662 [Daphnia pulex]|eukprot:EFX81257.1 hypothetical protein DAPPUDRAFT_102662 [Daphnia pulex]